ncbi:putative Transmembrane BAX inhibitor motif-containing protein [Zostera marina]|uniref:Putative Transmembrane BAX inhibitor motif-containing protein n=1 Tax=Zostera marina TaxID=29655 RepID=A0A0K9NGR4_ZOSMR|nr:putative Transmembrane BAX inhibitor motif-containing protein [Zostera marina]
MWSNYGKNGGSDLEYGGRAGLLYPTMEESPELRWSFIRKIYSILTIQLILTAIVATIVVTVKPITVFFNTTTSGHVLYIVLIIFPIIVLCPLFAYRNRHPVNYILLAFFTVGISFMVGIPCAFTSGKIILEAVILTAAVVVSLTLYTFWAVRRGTDFSFLEPFLFSALIVLLLFGFIQVFFPLGKISQMIYGGLGAIIFSGYIIYDTNNLIKRFSYDDYIWAAVSLYLDIINLFLALLNILRATD